MVVGTKIAGSDYMSTVISIRVSGDLETALKEAAEAAGLGLSDYVRRELARRHRVRSETHVTGRPRRPDSRRSRAGVYDRTE